MFICILQNDWHLEPCQPYPGHVMHLDAASVVEAGSITGTSIHDVPSRAIGMLLFSSALLNTQGGGEQELSTDQLVQLLAQRIAGCHLPWRHTAVLFVECARACSALGYGHSTAEVLHQYAK